MKTRILILALVLAGMLSLSGCTWVKITNNNVEIQVKKYVGSYEEQAECEPFALKNAEIWVDDEYYYTDSQGKVGLELEEGQHKIFYPGCSGKNMSNELDFKIEKGKIYYLKNKIYRNGYNETIPTQSDRLIELNIYCCTR